MIKMKYYLVFCCNFYSSIEILEKLNFEVNQKHYQHYSSRSQVVFIFKKQFFVFSNKVSKQHKYERPNSCSYRGIYHKFLQIHFEHACGKRYDLSNSWDKSANEGGVIPVFIKIGNTKVIVFFSNNFGNDLFSSEIANIVVDRRSKHASTKPGKKSKEKTYFTRGSQVSCRYHHHFRWKGDKATFYSHEYKNPKIGHFSYETRNRIYDFLEVCHLNASQVIESEYTQGYLRH